MVIPHYGLLKMIAWIYGIAGVILFALDPTVQVALIMSIPGTIAAVGAFIVGVRNTRKLTTIGTNVDGMRSRLEDKNVELDTKLTDKSDQLTDTKGKLSHAQGEKEGSDRERDKQAKP